MLGEMSLPDILRDIGVKAAQENESATSEAPIVEKVVMRPHSMPLCSALSVTPPSGNYGRHSVVSIESCEDSVSDDEGEAQWDSLGRMNSIRRSNRFDKPQLMTVILRNGKAGCGVALEGKEPPIIASLSGEALTSGLRKGDRLLEVNGESVRELSSEQVNVMLREAPEVVTIVVHTVKPTPTPQGKEICQGWLMKRGGSGVTPRNWRRRWFVVRDDCIAYYYSSPEDTRPRGAIVLRNYIIAKTGPDIKKPYSFKASKGGTRTYYFAADSEQEMNKWAQVFTEASTLEGRESVYFSGCAANISLSALSIKDPDCHGFLYKKGGSLNMWKRRYCVLKAHQLFYYGKMSHTTAYEVMNLSGYEVVKDKEKDKKFYFHVTPSNKEAKLCKFYTESEVERERWIDAMKRCIAQTK